MADTPNGEGSWAYVLTVKLLPTYEAHQASEAPSDLAMAMDASVQISAATCLVWMPDATAIIRATLLTEACTALPHAHVVSTTQAEKLYPGERHPSR